MIHELRDKFSIDSLSIATENKYLNVTEIPFPAVSIMEYSEIECNVNRYLEDLALVECYKNWDFEGNLTRFECDAKKAKTKRISKHCRTFG